jgi:hypothetical protein
MGGRGASSGKSNKEKIYGTEYSAVLKSGNIKFVKSNESGSTKTPMETMTKGRVYVTVNNKDELTAITYYDSDGKRTKQIDLQKAHKGIKPHTHHGYEHNENDSKKGASKLTPEERKMVDRINKIWYNNKSKR